MLTSNGFKRMRYADYLPIIEEQAKELFGEDANLSERTPLGKFIRLQAYQRAEDNEEAENLYNSRFVDTSEGVALQQNVKRALITKKEGLKSSGSVVLNLDRGVTVPTDYLFATPYGVKFRPLQPVTAVEDGNYTVKVECTEYGAIGNVEVNEITVIVNPLTGINSVTNPSAFVNGQDEETDEELRARYYQSLGKLGNRRTEAIRAKVLDEVDGVRACLVDENDTNVISSTGVPPKAFETIVLGGEREVIAQKIKEAKPGGIQAYGIEQVPVTDNQGKVHTIGFTYATTVNIYVKAHVKKTSSYPIDGDKQVKLAIIKFVGGTFENTKHNGLGMSVNVIRAKLESRLFTIEGIEDAKVSLSTDGTTYEEANIPIGSKEVAETDVSKIEVVNLV